MQERWHDVDLDDDASRVDREALWAFLSGQAYWSRWRSRADVDAQLDGAWRVVAAYDRGTGVMVGFARAVSDGVAFAYLADLYVEPRARGRGLGHALVEFMVDRGPGSSFRWMLHTRDARELYRKFGFTAPQSSAMERAADEPPSAPDPSPPRCPFRQVDVFGDGALNGNPVAVVHDADDLDDETMAALARWTNLSETTFLLAPTLPHADYRLRIFTPDRELPFAGHPTLGSAHAWLEAEGMPRRGAEIVQECGAGEVRVRRGDDRLSFAAPPQVRSESLSRDEVAGLLDALGLAHLDPDRVPGRWIDNGPGWVGLLLPDADTVLDLDPRSLGGFPDVGVAGLRPAGAETALEVRALIDDDGRGVREDPVTGSLNAALAQWLIGEGVLPPRYVAAQGTRRRRRGRVHVEQLGEDIWVGGATTTVVNGSVRRPDGA